MCFGSSSESTQTTKTAPLSPEGQTWNSLFRQIALENLDQIGGYDYTPEEKIIYSKPEDETKAINLEEKIKARREKIDAINKDIELNPYVGKWNQPRDPRLNEKDKLNRELETANAQLEALPRTKFTDYKLEKREDPRILDAIEKYGADAPQVKEMRSQVKQEGVFKAETMADIEKNYLTNLQKMARGEITYTAEQEANVDRYFGPLRSTIDKISTSLLDEAAKTDKDLRTEMENIRTEINNTGFALEDALKAAEIQIDRSGNNLLSVLQDVNRSSEKRARFQFDLLSEQADQKAAQQAALLGLPPGSQSEKVAAMNMKVGALKSIELDLAEQEAKGRLGIQEMVEGDKKNISLMKINLAGAQGGKKEDLAKIGLGIAEATGGKREGIAGTRGSSLLALEESRANQLLSTSYGQLPAAIQAAQSGISFGQASKANEMNLSTSLLSPISHARDIEEQRTMAETTVNTKQRQSGSIFDAITGGLGAIAGLASTGFTAAGVGGFGLPQISAGSKK